MTTGRRGHHALKSLPDPGFVIEPGVFEAGEITMRDNADNPAMFHHRNMAETAVMHQPQRVNGGMLRWQVIGCVGHHRMEMGVG